MTPLCLLAEKHGTNKHDVGYTPIYYDLLKDRPIQRVLELGIGGPGLSHGASRKGASLYMWRDFFPGAYIYGLDNNLGLLFEAPFIQTGLADVTDPTSLTLAADATGGRFDLIVDDAVHKPDVQLAAARSLLPYLTPTGVYVIEDVIDGMDNIIRALPRGYHVEIPTCPTDWKLLIIRK